MASGQFNHDNRVTPSVFRWMAVLLIVLVVAFLAGTTRSQAAEPTLSEYQVKSIFLLNFAKYVDWPVDAFSHTNTPVTIGIMGENKLGKDLEKTVENKQVGGRKIIIRHLDAGEVSAGCHILFISVSEKKRMPDILKQTRMRPVLTVGETESFTDQGGIIRFLIKEEKVRLEIDLKTAREARLQISSKLLSVADVVKGK